MTEFEPYVDAGQVAKVLGVPVCMVWKLTRENRIRCLRLVSKTYRYSLESVLAALDDGGETTGRGPR